MGARGSIDKVASSETNVAKQSSAIPSQKESIGTKRGHQRQRSGGSGVDLAEAVPHRDIKLYHGNGNISQWKKGGLVGKGATGAVFEATETASGEIFCVKEIEFTDDFADNPHDLQRFEALRREIDLLKEITHPNVVRFLGIDRVGFVIYIQMEYVYGGNIQDIVRNFGALSEDTACKFTLQLLEGLDYLHEKNIIHRDIKGANILVGVDGVVKLADFGAAKRALDSEQLFKTLAGTPYWMAPEVVRQEGHNAAADVWSLGATVLQMLTGYAPYQQLPPVPALFKIGHSNEPPFSDEKLSHLSPEALDFMRKCMTRNHNQRPTVKQLKSHPWILALDTGVEAPKGVVPPDHPKRLALRTSAKMAEEHVDEESQVREFVAYVSQRHKALQQEQLAQVKSATTPVREAVRNATAPPGRYEQHDDEVDSRGGDSVDDDDDDDDVVDSDAQPSALNSKGPTPKYETAVPSYRLEDDDVETTQLSAERKRTVHQPPQADDAFFADVEEFDESHFDEMVAGLGVH